MRKLVKSILFSIILIGLLSVVFAVEDKELSGLLISNTSGAEKYEIRFWFIDFLCKLECIFNKFDICTVFGTLCVL